MIDSEKRGKDGFGKSAHKKIRRVSYSKKKPPNPLDFQGAGGFVTNYLTANRPESIFIFFCFNSIDG